MVSDTSAPKTYENTTIAPPSTRPQCQTRCQTRCLTPTVWGRTV